MYFLALFFVVFSMLIIPAFAQSDEDFIPSWVKGVANFWIEGGIDDTEFIEALEYLIDNSIINLGENVVVDNTMSELQEENTILKEKLDNQEKDWQGQFFRSTKQHEVISNEYDQKLTVEKKRYDDMVEQKGERYRQAIQEYDDLVHEKDIEIKELKKQLKEK